ncbi:unnamed protein product [Gordionus sp. m RMFG-2023]|uniref:probable muscarinic acetylcholine receptor gar-1 n=1 Tax=Gordionus sp. m RMFG-2023 TaxID=3053472 RepID=UPI0030E5ABFA
MNTINATHFFKPSSSILTTAIMIVPSSKPFLLWQEIVIWLMVGILCFMTVIGNIMVILAFMKDVSIRQPNNYCIVSLAASDLLIGLFSMPFYTLYLLLDYWPLGPFLCDLWLTTDYTACLVSQYTVLLITVDRFCSVRIPARYRAWRTNNKLKFLIVFVWVLSFGIFFTSIVGWPLITGRRLRGITECYVPFRNNKVFNTALIFCYFWSSLIILLYLYHGIYRVAYKIAKKSDNRKLNTLLKGNEIIFKTATTNFPLLRTLSQRGSKYQSDEDRRLKQEKKIQQILGPDKTKLIIEDYPDDEDTDNIIPYESFKNKSDDLSPSLRAKNIKNVKTIKLSDSYTNGTSIDKSTSRSNSKSKSISENFNGKDFSLSNTSAPFVNFNNERNHSDMDLSKSLFTRVIKYNPNQLKLRDAPSLKYKRVFSETPSDNSPYLRNNSLKSVTGNKSMNMTNSVIKNSKFQKSGSEDDNSRSSLSGPVDPYYYSCIDDHNKRLDQLSSHQKSVKVISSSTIKEEEGKGSTLSENNKDILGQVQPNAALTDSNFIDPKSTPTKLFSKKTRRLLPKTPFFIHAFNRFRLRKNEANSNSNDALVKQNLNTDNKDMVLYDDDLLSRILIEKKKLLKPGNCEILSEKESKLSNDKNLNNINNKTGKIISYKPVDNSKEAGHKENNKNFERIPDNLKVLPKVSKQNNYYSNVSQLLQLPFKGPTMINGKINKSIGPSHKIKKGSDEEIILTNNKPTFPKQTIVVKNIYNNNQNNKSITSNITSLKSTSYPSSYLTSFMPLTNVSFNDFQDASNVKHGNEENGERLDNKCNENKAKEENEKKKRSKISNTLVAHKARSHKKRPQKNSRARKALKTITCIMGAFVLCWTPYHILETIWGFCDSCQINPHFYAFTYWLCYLNSPLNPFMYALANVHFKQAFIKLLNCKKID